MPLLDDVVIAPEDDGSIARPVPWGGLVAWLRSRSFVHRAVPLPVALRLIDVWKRRAVRRNPAMLADAEAAMRAVVGGTHRADEAAHLAFPHLRAWAHGWEHAWRPWRYDRIPIHGLDNLAGIEAGRGIVFSKTHSGPPASMGNLGRAVGPIYLPVGHHLLDPAPPGYNGYQNEQVRRLCTRSGFRMISAVGSRATFEALLRQGGRVLVNLDVPGSVPVEFLGKTVELKSGTARLAVDTDAVVVPVAMLPDGRGWRIHVDEPLDPRRYPDWQNLLQAVAAVHESLILAAPQMLESPLRDGGWVEATETGWRARPGV